MPPSEPEKDTTDTTCDIPSCLLPSTHPPIGVTSAPKAKPTNISNQGGNTNAPPSPTLSSVDDEDDVGSSEDDDGMDVSTDEEEEEEESEDDDVANDL